MIRSFGSKDIERTPEILMEDLIEGFRITQNKLAVSILARFFGTFEEFWMSVQSNYELRVERWALRGRLDAIAPRQSDD